jgi:hypothetical protein
LNVRQRRWTPFAEWHVPSRPLEFTPGVGGFEILSGADHGEASLSDFGTLDPLGEKLIEPTLRGRISHWPNAMSQTNSELNQPGGFIQFTSKPLWWSDVITTLHLKRVRWSDLL